MHEISVLSDSWDLGSWWKNFVQENNINTIYQANQVLEGYRGTVSKVIRRMDGDSIYAVQFKTEADFVLFKLKYSGK